MSQLMLVSGLKDGVSSLELVDYLMATYSVQNVWTDPNGEPRVVVLCDEKLDLSDIKIKARYLETAEPTASVFVKTYKCITFGAKDKLKYLFTSQRYGGQKVVKVEQLNTKDDDCYELVFLNWDDVLKICNVTWKVEEQTLTVIPFFDCFREPFKQQLKRLTDLNDKSTQAKRSFVSEKQTVNRPPVMLKSSEMPQKESFQSTNAFVDLKSAKPVLEHPYILTLLHLLNFQHAVQEKYNMVTVTICESNWEVTIKGPVASLKIIQKLLTEEDELDHPILIERFLGNETAMQDLKNFIDSAGLYVDIVDTQGKPFLQVIDGAERKEIFHNFIFTLVISKECSPLPSTECQQQQEWTNFVELFDRTYTHQQLFVEDTSVTLVCLASKSQEMDFIVNIINNTIIRLKRDLKPGSHQDESVPNPDQNSMIPDESGQSSGNTPSVGGKENTKFKTITICVQNSALLWILNILNLKNSLKQKIHNLDVDIDENEEEITISGSKDLLPKLKSVLTTEDKKFQFTENEKAFLCDPVVQKSLNSWLIIHGCCIVFSDDLEMFVARKNGHKAQFRNFLTSFIQFKTISHLPENYQQTKEWISLTEHCKNNYPHHHILTAEDKVYLMSIAPDENNTDGDSILKKVNTVITALTSPSLPEKHLPLAEEIGDQKCEEIKSDSGKISASDKSSMRKSTLYLKHPVLIRILQNLQLKEAAQKLGISVTMSSDYEIIIEGSKKAVKSLQSSLIKEDNEMPFEDQEEFLTDERIQQNVDSCLKASKVQLVLDDNLELFVVTQSGEKAQFKNFLTSFIHFKTVSHLPEKYQQTKEWNSLVEHCKKQYPHHHILTAEDKVYLLSIAQDQNNTDADSILKNVNTVVTTLTSSMLPEKHLSLVEEIGDKKCEEIKTGSSKISASDKSSMRKLILYLKHPVLIRILQNLQLKEAAQKLGICVTMSSDHEIIIEGSKKAVKIFQSTLIKEDNEMPFEDQEEFFTNPRVDHYLVSCLKDSKAHLVLDDSFELFVVTESGEKERFRAFITRFIQFRKCAHMPEKYQNDLAWKKKLQQFEEQNPHHHILINGEEVHLLTIASDDKSHEANSVMERINRAISDSCSPPDSDMNDEDEHHDFFINCHKIQTCYLHSFLIKEFQDEYGRWQSCRPEVTFKEDGLWISSSSLDATNNIASKLQELLSTIKRQTKSYNFPGLSTYLNSTGTSLINNLSDQYRCLIDVPDRGNSRPQHLSLNEEQSSDNSQRLAYKVIFLGTAVCDRFNVHLVQGDVNDLNLEMKIQLQPSEEVENCEIKSRGSSQNIIIQLPLWSAPNEDSYHSHFETLRSSFHDVISLAFEQAKHLKCNDIAFSTAHLTKSEHPFPSSVIAKGIIEMLFEKTGLNFTSQTENKKVDIYVCDPDNEAVFKAFEFFLKLRQVIVGTPSQSAWNKVCFPDSYTCPDFNHFKLQGCQIEVSSNILFYLGNNACVFYPIHPSLDINTCPAIKEHSSVEWSLKSSIRDLQHQYPDGFVPGDMAPLKGFQDSRNAFVYCSPDWGTESGKVIETLLEMCIRTHYEVVYIVPPGVQMPSMYPVDYLVQIFFRKLDNIAQRTQLLERNRQLVLLVQDPDYRKAFDQELKKRYPSKKNKGLFDTVWSYLWHKDKENSSYKKEMVPKTITKESSVPSTDITFFSTSDLHIQNAAMDLEKELKRLMKENSSTIQLNKQETYTFQNLLQNISSDILVKLSFKEWYAIESTHTNKGRSSNASYTDKVQLMSSSLTINGLCPIYLNEFLIKAGLIKDTEKDVKKRQK